MWINQQHTEDSIYKKAWSEFSSLTNFFHWSSALMIGLRYTRNVASSLMSFILEQIISSYKTIFVILRPRPPKLIKYQEVANLTKNQINAHLLYNDVLMLYVKKTRILIRDWNFDFIFLTFKVTVIYVHEIHFNWIHEWMKQLTEFFWNGISAVKNWHFAPGCIFW